MTMRKPPFWASVCTIAGVAVLCSLGTWQANKYIAKTADMGSAACQNEEMFTLSESFANIDSIRAQLCRDKIELKGRLNTENLIALGPRVYDGEPGYHLYAALEAEDDTSILVNMGWQKEKLKALIINHIESAPDEYSISGVLVKPSGRNAFTPDNNPEKNEYYYIQPSEIAAQWNVEGLSPYLLFAQDIQPPHVLNLPKAELSKTYLTPQTHLQYASFWYFMALAMIAVFFFRFVYGKKD